MTTTIDEVFDLIEDEGTKEDRLTVYDILDNFYEIPMEIVKKKVRYVDVSM